MRVSPCGLTQRQMCAKIVDEPLTAFVVTIR